VLQQVKIDGLFLEFGVREGDSINYIAHIISPHIIYGFDSFEGLPETWERKRDGSLNYEAGTFTVEKIPEVRANVVLIKGWFSDTLPLFANNELDKVAFINIDSDLYSSARTVLTVLNKQIVNGYNSVL
jgi:hypothetical protein